MVERSQARVDLVAVVSRDVSRAGGGLLSITGCTMVMQEIVVCSLLPRCIEIVDYYALLR